MSLVWTLYTAGVAAGAAAGFCSPFRYLGFVPICVGAVWAAYDLVQVGDADGDTATTAPRRRNRRNRPRFRPPDFRIECRTALRNPFNLT